MTTGPWVYVDQCADHLVATRDSSYRGKERTCVRAHSMERLSKLKTFGVAVCMRAGGAEGEAHLPGEMSIEDSRTSRRGGRIPAC